MNDNNKETEYEALAAPLRERMRAFNLKALDREPLPAEYSCSELATVWHDWSLETLSTEEEYRVILLGLGNQVVTWLSGHSHLATYNAIMLHSTSKWHSGGRGRTTLVIEIRLYHMLDKQL
jgi:hypothetical protein